MCALAEKKSIRISYEAIGGELGAGGLCKVKGVHRVIVDKRARAASGPRVWKRRPHPRCPQRPLASS